MRPYWDEVTWITGVPTVLARAVESHAIAEAIRIVSFGGEQLDRATVERVRGAAPGVRILNLYGPTEITVLCDRCGSRSRRDGPVPIGTPLSFSCRGTSSTRHLTSCRVGCGQLAVGDIVSRWDTSMPRMPAQTASCPDPFVGQGARMHPHGDLGFRDGQGQIHLVGRIDSQEDSRVRIHLGGVEALLRRHPQVADAACFVINKGGSAAYLAAALVTHASQTPASTSCAWMQRFGTASHVPDSGCGSNAYRTLLRWQGGPSLTTRGARGLPAL